MSREVLIKLLIKMALANSEHFTLPSTVLAPEMHCLVTHDSPKRQTLALAPFHRWGACVTQAFALLVWLGTRFRSQSV